MTPPLEHDYIGIGLPSAAASSTPTTNATNALKTDLRLGLPGSESPERAANGVTGLTLVLTPRAAAGSKRGFSDSSSKWVFGGSEPKPKTKVDEDNNKLQLQPNNNPVPAAKAQVVGWPPVRNYRKNTMASNSNTNPSLKKKKEEEEGEGKIGSGCLYVKVSMDGAPYLRKVDLKMYSNYKDLSLALQKMFSCFTIGKFIRNLQWHNSFASLGKLLGKLLLDMANFAVLFVDVSQFMAKVLETKILTGQCGSHRMAARDGQGESRLADHGSENVLTYEDKDGDWMLVGDVPWDMFTETCRRLRIMKGSDAIGLAPRATGKSKNQN